MRKLFMGRRIIFGLIAGIFALSMAFGSLGTPVFASGTAGEAVTTQSVAYTTGNLAKGTEKDKGKLCERLTDHIKKLESGKDKLQHRLDALNDRLAKAKTEDEKERLGKRINTVKDHLEKLNKKIETLHDKKDKHNCADK